MATRFASTSFLRTFGTWCILMGGISSCNIIADALCDLTGEESDCLIQETPYYDTGMYDYSYPDDEDEAHDNDGGSEDSDDGGSGSGTGGDGGGSGSGTTGGDDDGGSGSGTTGGDDDGGSSSGTTGGDDDGGSGSGTTDGDDDGGSGSGSGDDGDEPAPGDPCWGLDIYTCDLTCSSAAMIEVWRGDGHCHDDSPDLNCAAFDYDDGDCAEGGGTGGSSSGGDGESAPGGSCAGGDGTYDCELSCRATSILEWVGDDYCDDGSGEGPDLNCEAFDYDGGDCEETGGGGSSSGGSGETEICENTCEFASDGECDDGGPGSAYSFCDYGTDCDDCGVRAAR